MIFNVESHEITISDHDPISVFLELKAHTSSNPRFWQFPAYLLNNADFQAYMARAWEEFSSANATCAVNNLFWEAARLISVEG